MAALFRRQPIEPEFIIPPAETRESAVQRAEIEEINRELVKASQVRPWSPATIARINALLDQRNAIRAPRPPAEVPVIPGRAS